MSSSDLSDLSSPLSTDQDVGPTPPKSKNLDHYFKNAHATKPSPPPKKKRLPSPPHEYVLADNPDIAVSAKANSSNYSVGRVLTISMRVVHLHVPFPLH